VARRKRLVAGFTGRPKIPLNFKQFLVALFLLLKLPAYGQLPEVAVTIYPLNPQAGQNFQVSFIFPVMYNISDNFVATALAFPRGLTIISGPTARVNFNPVLGDSVEYSYILRAAAGSYEIAPVRLDTAQGTLWSNPFPFTVSPAPPAGSTPSPALAWRAIPNSLYAGQSFTLVLEARNLRELSPLPTVNLPAITGLQVAPAGAFGGITYEQINGSLYYHIPVGSWLVNATAAGRITLPAMSAVIAGAVRTAPPAVIDIFALPAAVSHNAVGRFNLSTHIWLNGQAWQGDTIPYGSTLNVVLLLEGEGNFNRLTLPALQLNGFEVIDSNTSEELRVTGHGLAGFKRVEYRLRPSAAGEASLAVTPFNWLDTASGQVIQPANLINYFNIQPEAANLLPVLSVEEILAMRDFRVWPYVLPLILLAGLLVGQFFKPKPQKKVMLSFFMVMPLLFSFKANLNIESLIRAAEAKQSGFWHEAIAFYALAEGQFKHNQAAINYNKALMYQQLGECGYVVYYLHKAYSFNPFNKRIAGTLTAFEQSQNLTTNIRLTVRQSWLFPLLVSFALLFAGLTLIIKSKGYRFLLSGLAIVLALAATGYVIYANHLPNNRVIVLEEVQLFNIPSSSASLLTTARAGQSFTLVTRYSNYLLLRDAINGESWAGYDGLMFLSH